MLLSRVKRWINVLDNTLECILWQTQNEYELMPDRSSLLQLVAQGRHGSLHALVLLSLTFEDRCLGLDLLDDLIQNSAHSPGLLLLKLKLSLTFCVRIIQLNTGTEEEELLLITKYYFGLNEAKFYTSVYNTGGFLCSNPKSTSCVYLIWSLSIFSGLFSVIDYQSQSNLNWQKVDFHNLQKLWKPNVNLQCKLQSQLVID